MTPFQTAQEAKIAIQRYMMQFGADLPPKTQQHVIESMAEPVTPKLLVGVMESLYAARDYLTTEGEVLTAQLAAFIVANGFYDVGKNGRGAAIMQAMRRESGEEPPVGMSWPPREDDPEPDPRYTLVEEPEIWGGRKVKGGGA